jgi:hypothetical protein
MACGGLDWWRDPNIDSILEFAGIAEHLAIQVDFVLMQPHWIGWPEFSIPGASKSRAGATGYADIVSLSRKFIWEIKPKHREAEAHYEARKYVNKANISCGGGWELGTGYSTSRKDKVTVFAVSGFGKSARLLARQGGQPGTVLYEWEVNGRKLPDRVMDPFYARAVREKIAKDFIGRTREAAAKEFAAKGKQAVADAVAAVDVLVDALRVLTKQMQDLFGSSATQPLPGASAMQSHFLPPLRWKPVIARVEDALPELRHLLSDLVGDVECVKRAVDGGAIAVLVEQEVFNLIVGERMNRDLRAKVDPLARRPDLLLYRKTLAVMGSIVAGQVIVMLSCAIVGLAGPKALAGLVDLAVKTAGQAVLLVGRTVMVAIRAAARAQSQLGRRFIESFERGVPRLLTEGGSLAVFAVPYARKDDPDAEPTEIRAARPVFKMLNPAETAAAQVGEAVPVDGVDYRIVAIFRARPD